MGVVKIGGTERFPPFFLPQPVIKHSEETPKDDKTPV